MPYRLFNIGNTHVRTAELADDGTLSGFRTYDTEGFDPAPLVVPRMAVVSVVPVLEEYFRREGAFILDWQSAECVISLEMMKNHHTVGADRIANAAALVASGTLPALCIDFGTAITFEFVDAKRRLRGGAILPGRMMLRKALHEFTAKLPMIDMADTPLGVPGICTRDAMRIGTDTGAVGAVREILEEFRSMEPSVRVVFCGGDAPYFLRYFSGVEYADLTFTLEGLANALRAAGGK